MSSQMPVDFNDIRKEVSSPDFAGANPTNEYDHNTIRELASLLQEGQNILNNPQGLNQDKIHHLTIKLRQVKAEILRQAPLVRNLSR